MKNQDIPLDVSKWNMPTLEKPLGLLKGILKVLYGISTAAIPLPTGSIFHTTTGASEILESFGVKKNTGQIGWELISRSLIDAFFKLTSESFNDLGLEEGFLDSKLNELDKLDEQLNDILKNEKYYIYRDFFKTPEKHPIINASRKVLDEYLKMLRYGYYQRENILNRLKIYFAFSLVQEWRQSPSTYKELVETLNTPFNDAEDKAYQWLCYRQYLIKEVHSPVFQETFSLHDIYIPLRAYYETAEVIQEGELKDGVTLKTEVVKIDDYLLGWVNNGRKNDNLKIVSGGPGYGKSSMLKMLAAKLAQAGKNVLFIPLHRFELKNDLEEAVKKFLNYDKYITTFNPIEDGDVIIIFDGLDELDMQGGLLADIAQNFIGEVKSKADNYNHSQSRLKVIISGRDVIIQQNESSFRKEAQCLKLLPYLIEPNFFRFRGVTTNLVDLDQRDLWWIKYGKLKGKEYKGLPEELRKDDLDEITAQPLLNYLVTLSYERGVINFTKDINLNKVYKDLLDAVYERSYASGGRIKNISKLPKEHFTRMLEEIAVSAWHGNGRKTSIGEIRSHFDSNSLTKLMEQFAQDAEKGVISLLAAFYFRQADTQADGSQTFEFTHKSFGEYLLAKRIVEQVKSISSKMNQNKVNFDEGFDVNFAMRKWIKMFGPMSLDMDTVKFIRNEINVLDVESLKEVQTNICELINYELKSGLPIERGDLNITSYKEENKYAINAERGLFVMHSLIANMTNICSDIEWGSEIGFGNLLRRVAEQRVGSYVFIYRFFNHINAKSQNLVLQDLYQINLYYSNLEGADLTLVNLNMANLINSNLKKAILINASLTFAVLQNANLSNARLDRAFLNSVNFNDANLSKASFLAADLRNSIMKGANLTKAILDGALLTGANMEEAILTETNLVDVNSLSKYLKSHSVQRPHISKINFTGANLTKANFTGANFRGMDFTKANIEKCKGIPEEILKSLKEKKK